MTSNFATIGSTSISHLHEYGGGDVAAPEAPLVRRNFHNLPNSVNTGFHYLGNFPPFQFCGFVGCGFCGIPLWVPDHKRDEKARNWSSFVLLSCKRTSHTTESCPTSFARRRRTSITCWGGSCSDNLPAHLLVGSTFLFSDAICDSCALLLAYVAL